LEPTIERWSSLAGLFLALNSGTESSGSSIRSGTVWTHFGEVAMP